MSIKEVKKLMELLEKSNLDSIEYKDENFEVKLKKPSMVQSAPLLSSAPQVELIKEETSDLYETINAPLVGVFYSKPSPDKDAYVTKGKQVSEGDILCIIEAMKVMNEIKATKSGIIEEILVNDGDAVSFDQPLFKIS